jgi:GNAT superfamily N-acetyltransferase
VKHIEVRKAVREDVRAVSEITAEAFHKYALDLGMPQLVGALRETPKDVLHDITHKRVYLGLLGDEPVGSIRFEVLGGSLAYISRFGVKLIAQGCGMGRALIKVVEEKSRHLGLKAIALHTSSRMASLVRFYYGNGFYIHSTSTEKGYIRALLVRELTDDAGSLDFEALVAGK